MRTAVTLGRRHDAKTFALLSGPEVPVQAQTEAFKEFRRSATHAELASVQLWVAEDAVREHKLAPAAAKKTKP